MCSGAWRGGWSSVVGLSESEMNTGVLSGAFCKTYGYYSIAGHGTQYIPAGLDEDGATGEGR